MRFPALFLLLSATTLPAAEIPKGSHALLSFINSVSTRTAREGDSVYFRTATPIVANGAIVVPTNSYVQGVVTHSKRIVREKGGAGLTIRIQTLTLPTAKLVNRTPTLASPRDGGGNQNIVCSRTSRH